MISDDDADAIEDNLLGVIEDAIRNHPRSLQASIGPSEIGTPCDKRLGYKLAGIDEINVDPDVAWRPTVGIAVHTWLAKTFEARVSEGYWPELRTACFTLGGVPVEGETDLYVSLPINGRKLNGILDWKIVGPTTIKSVKANQHPGQKYEVQVNTYGRGVRRGKGYQVDFVAIMFLPSNGELHQRYFWIDEFKPELAADAVARVREIHAQVEGYDDPESFELADILDGLPTASDYCHKCPWHNLSATLATEGCHGDASLYNRPEATSESFLGID